MSSSTSSRSRPAANTLTSACRSATVTVSSSDTARRAPSTRRRLMCSHSAAVRMAGVAAPVSSSNVSKNVSFTTFTPSLISSPRRMAVLRCTRWAMRRMPSGPCHTAYMPAITASSTCAVQMLDVAFSRRMCCSRVCSARRIAGLPCASFDTPTRRPAMLRLKESLQAMKPACGPPKPNGTPKRCAEPMAMSAPHSPGAANRASASRSVAQATTAPCAWAASASLR
ncbi:hypothetical protein D3C77_507470 [compost metagenome]